MGWLWLGLLIGLLVGAAAVALLLRAVGRITGADPRGLGRLVLDGLAPGGRREGVAAQRALAKRLRRAGEPAASGRRVAGELLTVHVSPEDHDAIADALGVEQAETDLADFYREHATRARWILGAEPRVQLVRDISLRPRQSFVRATTRAVPAAPRPAPPQPATAHPAPARPAVAYPTGVHHPATAAITDELPRGLAAQDASVTAVYPAGLLLGDLIVVHGTDVRTVTAGEGSLRIGRGAHNDVVLDRPGVGRDHLVLEARADGWWAVPGTAQDETKLDGEPLEAPTPIGDEAVLELGRGVRVRLTVRPT